MVELIFLGAAVGLLSGFFGIGGGTILVPVLLLLGYDIKTAIGISIVQMVFSSVYGSYLNRKKGTLDVGMISTIGLGGFIGALSSGTIAASVDDLTLEVVFLIFATFALVRLFFKTKECHEPREDSKFVLFLIGFVVGAISMTIGVGGSILIVPILVGFLHVPLKQAISAGLFFVVFSSISGFISHTLSGHVDINSGLIIGLASLIGVYFGIVLKDKTDTIIQKRLLVVFYLMIVTYLFSRIFFRGI